MPFPRSRAQESGRFERHPGEIGFNAGVALAEHAAEALQAQHRPSDNDGFIDRRADPVLAVWDEDAAVELSATLSEDEASNSESEWDEEDDAEDTEDSDAWSVQSD